MTAGWRLGSMVAAVGACAAIIGCGAGGGGGGGATGTYLSGVVTDVDGKPVAGARVACAKAVGTSLANGTYTLSGVPSGYQDVFASTTIHGLLWTGLTTVDVLSREQNRSVSIMLAPETSQGGMAGSVIDNFGQALEGAKVFVAGPFASTMAVTDRFGNYSVELLTSSVTYTVTCSLAGYVNDTRTVRVDSGRVSAVSFALNPGSPAGAIPAPTGLSAQAWTVADTISRADARTDSVYQSIKRMYRHKSGRGDARPATIVEHRRQGRSTPLGSVVEIDLFWTYKHWDDLLGFAIKRGPTPHPTRVVAVLRDPLASVFFDLDDELTPDVPYYYTVHSLDTISFPDTGAIGPASTEVSANPLQPCNALLPSQGSSVTGDPVLQWTSVYGATDYQVIVWNEFPALQNADDPDGVAPIWPANMNQPGASLVAAPNTSVRYSGPVLSPGRTYYWLVVASDGTGQAYSVCALRKFTAR